MEKHLDGYAGNENSHARKFLIRIGGRNEFGFPNYRLVESERVLERIGAEWHDWDDNLETDDRAQFLRKTFIVKEKKLVKVGKIFKEVEADVEKSLLIPGNTPVRTVKEIRLVPKYSHLDEHGWILERYYGPEDFGSKAVWLSQVVEGTDIPRLGPFPGQGRYEMIAGIFPQVPGEDFMQQLVAYQKKKGDAQRAMDLRTIHYEKMRRHEKEEERKRELAQQKVKDLISPFFGHSLEAGRWRSRILEKQGIRSHMGN